MHYRGALDRLEAAVMEVESVNPLTLDVDVFTSLTRRLSVVHNEVLGQLDDVSAARCAGTSVREVRSQRAAVRKVDSAPEAAEAVASGSLSLQQAEIVADNPEVASELLAVASGKTPEELKSEAAKLMRNSAVDESERYRRLWRKRSVRSWVDGDGLVNILAKLTPDDGAVVLGKIRNAENSFARAIGSSAEAHRADAFVELLSAGGSGGKSKTIVNVHVDRESLSRGWVENDGFCEIAGLGSIPVAKAQSCFEEAVIRVLVTSDNKLVWAGQLSSELPQRVKDAVNAHNRHRCVRCGGPAADVDHNQARTNGGSHETGNLQTVCEACHGEKTLKDAPWSARYYEDRRPRAG